MTIIENPERKRLRDKEHLLVGEIQTIDSYTSSRMEYTTGNVEWKDGHFFERRVVKVGDESDPETRQRFYEKAEGYERLLEMHQNDWMPTYFDRDAGKLVIDPNNLAAMDLYYDENYNETLMTKWGEQMIQAIALEPLQNLSKGGRFLPGGRLDMRTLNLFTNMPDGIGLRSRQHIYADSVVERRSALPGDEIMQVVSLGSGASVPNVEAAQKAAAVSTGRIHWQFFDTDPNALKSADHVLSDADLDNSTFDFGPKVMTEDEVEAYVGRSYIEARHLENESIDFVDALGLWEYLTDNQAVMFLKMLYAKLKKGGVMVVSNMKADRPQPLYNKSAVGWPKLIMRTEEDMLRIVEQAGISTDMVTITHSDDGVYMVMEVRK